MAETISDRTKNIRAALGRTAQGMSTNDDLRLMEADYTIPLETALKILHVAALQNVFQTVTARHEQIALALYFSKYVTFYARRIAPDFEFWSQEIKADSALHGNLIHEAGGDLDWLAAKIPQDQEIFKIDKAHRVLAGEFIKRQNRLINNSTMYEASEAPPETRDQAETKLKALRQQQFASAVQSIGLLQNTALLCVRRIDLVKKFIGPLFEKAGDPAADTWNNDIKAEQMQAAHALNQADVLHSHLGRLYSFEKRLDQAKNPKSSPP